MEEMNQEIVTNQEQAIEQVPQESLQAQDIAQQAPINEEKERNFAYLREKAERAERERDEAIQYIRRMQMQNSSQNSYSEQGHADDDSNLSPDDFTEKRYVDKRIKNLENQIRHYEQYTQSNVAEARIRSQYNDFDQVVTPETIEILKNTYPEVAQTLHSTPDLYSKAVSTYNVIKKFGIAKQPNPQAEYDRQLAQRNASKPRATNSVSPQQGETPLNKANEWANGILTPERKAQLYKEMMDAAKNI